MKKANGKVLVVLNSHPELYPPTLNAVSNLADHFGEVHLLYKPHKADEWDWPGNVHLHRAGGRMSTRAFMQSSFARRMSVHLRVIVSLLALLIRLRPGVVLLYDPYPALFYKLVYRFLPIRKPFLWYHNHDVIENADLATGDRMIRELSKAEKWVISKADLFTLPAVERKSYFDMAALKGKYFTLPNFPSKKVYSSFPLRLLAKDLTLAFQGSICEGRGLEGMISLMPLTIKGLPVRFSVIGFCNNEKYLQTLEALKKPEDGNGVVFKDAVAYGRLADVLRDAHVGWVFYGMGSNMDQSIGTASNKFFECCAMGLPVLYNEQNSFEVYRNFKWAIPVALTKESITEKLEYIVNNYASLSSSAYRQFVEELNFENAFEDLLKLLPLGIR